MRGAELGERSVVSVRPVRFYHQTGVLPRPRMRGRVGCYGEEHLERLASVRRLQQRGYFLAAIADMLAAQVPDGFAQELVRLGLVAPAEGGEDAGFEVVQPAGGARRDRQRAA